MNIVDIKASKRESKGKKAAKALRAEGSIPAVIYGVSESEKIALNTKEVFKALSGENGKSVILQLGMDGENSRHALLKELQYHPITDKIFHVDFLEIDIKKPLKSAVKLKFVGEAVGVKIFGGNLSVHKDKLQVEGLPEAIPSVIEINISALEIGDKLTVNDIEVPEGVKKHDDPEASIVSVAQPKRGPGGGEEEGAEAEAEGGDTAKAEPAGDAKAEGASEGSDKKK